MGKIKGAKWMCVFLGLCTFSPEVQSGRIQNGLTPVFEWSQLEFEYNSLEDRQSDIDSEFFIPGVPAMIDSDIYYSGNQTSFLFVTIPRFQYGIPVTLGVVTNNKYRGNNLIRPYPSWSWHRNPTQCLRNRLISVYRIQIDKCGRIWVLDTGRYGEDLICAPQILAFEIETGRVLYRYEIPEDQYESRSIFVTPIADVRETCEDTFVYAADCQTYSIVVYDTFRETSWRINDKTMYPYPNFGTFSILGDSFDLMDGILGMSLTPYIPGRDRKLYFHAMSSNTENWVYTSDLRDNDTSSEDFYVYRGLRSSQSAAEAIDRNGIMYFGVMSDVTFDCWDINTEYGPKNIRIVDDNETTLQFASGVKVIDDRKGAQELLVVTSRFQKIGAGTIDTNEINFRILARKIDNRLVKWCKPYSTPPDIFHPANFIGGGYGFRTESPKSYVEFERTF